MDLTVAAVAQVLTDGEDHGIRILQACLVDAEGIPREAAHGERLSLASFATMAV